MIFDSLKNLYFKLVKPTSLFSPPPSFLRVNAEVLIGFYHRAERAIDDLIGLIFWPSAEHDPFVICKPTKIVHYFFA